MPGASVVRLDGWRGGGVRFARQRQRAGAERGRHGQARAGAEEFPAATGVFTAARFPIRGRAADRWPGTRRASRAPCSVPPSRRVAQHLHQVVARRRPDGQRGQPAARLRVVQRGEAIAILDVRVWRPVATSSAISFLHVLARGQVQRGAAAVAVDTRSPAARRSGRRRLPSAVAAVSMISSSRPRPFTTTSIGRFAVRGVQA